MAVPCCLHVSHMCTISCPVASLSLGSSTHSCCELKQAKRIGAFPCIIKPCSRGRRRRRGETAAVGASSTASDAFEDPASSSESNEQGAGFGGTLPKKDGNKKSDLNAHVLVPPQCSLLQSLCQEAARSLILQAALLGTESRIAGSGSLEAPSCPIEGPTRASDDHVLKQMPIPILYQLPRRRIRIAFNCNSCQQQTTRAINLLTYIDGTVFVQVSNIFFQCIFNLLLWSLPGTSHCAHVFGTCSEIQASLERAGYRPIVPVSVLVQKFRQALELAG